MEGSILAKITNTLLKISKPKYMNSYDEVMKYLDNKSSKPFKKVKSIFKSFDFNGMQVFKMGNESKSKNIILFIHGGAYINEINYQHLLYCYALCRKLNAYVLAPVYPLTPKHNCCETYSLIRDLYCEIIKKDFDKIILVGDSAGGGFVLSFCQYLNENNLPQPDNIICFSPWVDISMSGDYKDIEKTDPILGEIGLREIGKAWAGNLSVKDAKVSPIYGNNQGLARTLMFTGTNEIFYPDIKKYSDLLQKDGVNFTLVEKKDMFHIYPMFPISESRHVLNKIKKEIEIEDN